MSRINQFPPRAHNRHPPACSPAIHVIMVESDLTWFAMPLVGRSDADSELDVPALELRNCHLCGSTLSRELAS